jgi:hypothetical protein
VEQVQSSKQDRQANAHKGGNPSWRTPRLKPRGRDQPCHGARIPSRRV